MARFRGVVQGGRGEATRLGHSGLTVRAESWQGAVRVTMQAAGEHNRVTITAESHGAGDGHPMGQIFDGPISDLHGMIALWRQRDQFQAFTALTEGVIK